MHNPGISLSEPSDNSSVNYVLYKGDYYVSNETVFMHKVDPETLETKEKVWAGGVRELGADGAEPEPRGAPIPKEFLWSSISECLKGLCTHCPAGHCWHFSALPACLGLSAPLAEQETTFSCVLEKVLFADLTSAFSPGALLSYQFPFSAFCTSSFARSKAALDQTLL